MTKLTGWVARGVGVSICCLVGALAVGCNGDDSDSTNGGGGGGGSTDLGGSSVPDGTTLSSLTPDQVQTIATNASSAAATDDVSAAMCKLSGLLGASFALFDPAVTDATVQSTCQAAYDECMTAPAETPVDTSTTSFAECEATVGELEACYAAQMDMIADLGAALPACSSVTVELLNSESSIDMSAFEETPAACAALQEKCPELMDSGSDTGGDFTCANGETTFSAWVCDGEADCSDGSDEVDCG